MKNDRGKIILIVALIACFGALFWLCGSRETVTEMYDYHHALRNETVSIELREGGNLYVTGEGKLPGVDMIRLMDEGKIKKTDAVNVFIDDRFTELGYYIANGYKNLVALRVGDGVKVIHNGAVKSCSSLQYVYLPKGLEKVGMDFMYGCSNVFIVTDGAASDLPELPGVSPDRILADVHSYAELVERRSNIPALAYPAEALLRDDPEAPADPSTVNPGCAIATPIFALDPGTYTVRLFGDGLDALEKDDVTVAVDGALLTDFTVTHDEGVLACKFTIPNRAEAVEILATNRSELPVAVTAINAYDNSFSIPPALMNWWA